MLQLRKGEDIRWHDVSRDLKNCMLPMMKAACIMTETAFSGNKEKMRQLDEFIKTLIETLNAAKRSDSGTTMNVLRATYAGTKNIDPEVQLMYMSNFLFCVMGRYIAGIRGSSTAEMLSELDITNVGVVANMALFIPYEYKKAFEEKMRDRSMWGPLDDLGIFEESEMIDPPSVNFGGK